jgi:hypothetical protein
MQGERAQRGPICPSGARGPMNEPTANTSAAHFQIFALDGKTDIRWRLLSANNRELGRGYSLHETAGECVAAIKAMVDGLGDLVALTRRREGNLWQWVLYADDEPVAVSGHNYDRQIRSQEAVDRFRSQAGSARIGETIVHTGARRWVRPSLRRVV